jgi:hypothetical protein
MQLGNLIYNSTKNRYFGGLQDVAYQPTRVNFFNCMKAESFWHEVGQWEDVDHEYASS